MATEPRDKQHLLVPEPPKGEVFTPISGGGGNKRLPYIANRKQHGENLKAEFQIATNPDPNDQSGGVEDRSGTYITFASFPGFEFVLESLDSTRKGNQPELIAVSVELTEEGIVQHATVYIPNGKKGYFLKKLDQYLDSIEKNLYLDSTENNKFKNKNLLETIASIHRATIQEMWTDPIEEFPTGPEQVWWELWLRRRHGGEIKRLRTYSNRMIL